MADQPTPGPRKSTSKADLASIGGVILAMGGIVGGLILEGGNIHDVAQFTAAVIVLGGTFGAVMVNTPITVLSGAIKRLAGVFFEKEQDEAAMIDEIIAYATKARKNGLVSLEQDAEEAPNPFLRKALLLAVDGSDMQEIRKMMELQIGLEEHRAEEEAKVFEAAGGFAPTIGIIGAVLGLIQVMKNLSDIKEVGHGIAVAFVATVYGVGVANIFFLPAANKIKARVHKEAEMKELILEGVLAIVEGLNPKLIKSKLEAYIHQPAASEAEPQRAPAQALREY